MVVNTLGKRCKQCGQPVGGVRRQVALPSGKTVWRYMYRDECYRCFEQKTRIVEDSPRSYASNQDVLEDAVYRVATH
jgi:hypothetical protein